MTFSKGRIEKGGLKQQGRWIFTDFLPQKQTFPLHPSLANQGEMGQFQVPFLILMEQLGCGIMWAVFRGR